MIWARNRVISLVIGFLGLVLFDKFILGLSASYDYVKIVVMMCGVFVTLAVSLNLINGITGQFSIGHAAFFQVGAYTCALLSSSVFQSFSQKQPVLWLLFAALFGAIGAAIAGFIIGLPSLRLKGDYLAVVTLGFGEIISIIVRNQKALGEAYGKPVDKIHSVFMVWGLAVLAIAVCRNLLKTAHGLSFLAVREDEVASSAMGVNVTKIKVTAFVIGSAFAGAAGALMAHTKAFVTPQDFSMDVSFIILTMVVLGGTGSITGSVIAAIIFYIIPEKMRDLPPSIPMHVPVAALFGIIAAVIGMRAVQQKIHDEKLKAAGLYVLSMIGGTIVAFVLNLLLKAIPPLQATIIGSNLRMPVLAITLVVLMLLRPQGIFGHHEFSLDWMKGLFKRKSVATSGGSPL